MQLFSFLGLAAAFASVTAAQAELPPKTTNLKYDKTADWYKDHGMQVPEVAAYISVIEPNRSYVVRLECPGCPFLVQEGKQLVQQKRDNTLVSQVPSPCADTP